MHVKIICQLKWRNGLLNWIKKTLCMIITVIMTVGISIGTGTVDVNAAAGDVTVTPASGQTLTQATNDEVTAGDKIISITTPSGITNTDTVTYTIYKIFNAVTSSAGTTYTTIPGGLTLPFYDNGEEASSSSKFDLDSAGNLKYYTKPYSDWVENGDYEFTDTLSSTMITALGQQTSKFTTIGTVTITGPNQTAHVKVSDYGYYFISTSVGSAVAIDTTHPSISITDKSLIPSLDKKQSLTSGAPTDSDSYYAYNDSVYTKDDLSASVGDTIYYNVPIAIPKRADKDIVITDLVSEGLTLDTSYLLGRIPDNFDEDSSTFSNYNPSPWNMVGLKVLSTTWVQTEGDYDENGNTWNEGTSSGLKCHKYTVTIPSGVLKYLSHVGAYNNDDPYTFTLYYKATLNSNAQNERVEKNRVQLTYEQYTSPFHEVQVTPYGFDLVKTDKDKNILGYNTTNGGIGTDGSYATFKLYKANEDRTAPTGDPITFVETTKNVGESDSDTNKGLVYNYRVAMSGETSTDTIKSGDVRIGGLATGTYYLVEEKAPDGYNKITSNVKVVVGANGITVGNGTANTARYATVTVGADNRSDAGPKSGKYTSGGVQVENQAGTVLPSTGGIGTTVFYVTGGILIIGTIILLMRRKNSAA